MIPFAFETGMGFERYVDWALDVPLYFVKRGDDLSRRRRRLLPRPAGRQARRAAGRAGDDVGLGQPSRHAVPRGAAEALPRDARRRCRADGAPRRALRLLGRPSLRRGRARRGLGSRQGLDARRSARRCATRCRARRCRRRSERQTAGAIARQVLAIARAGLEARNFQDWEGRTEAHFLDQLDAVVEQRRHRRRPACWPTIAAPGTGRYRPRLRHQRLLIGCASIDQIAIGCIRRFHWTMATLAGQKAP